MPAPLGSTPGIIVGVGVGAAVSTALTPALEVPKQEAWARLPNRVLDVGTLARLVAQGGVILGGAGDKDGAGAYAEALRQGYSSDKLDRLIWLAQTVPGMGEARALRRRAAAAGDRQISLEQLHHVYAKNQIEPQYWGALDELVLDILSPGELAAGIHRGLIEAPPGLLLGEQPKPPFNVDRYPVYPIDALAEALGSGYNRDRLGVLIGLQGLPMGVIEAAHAHWRGILTRGDYLQVFRTSNSRNEYADAVLEYSRQIPTARDFMENALRGHHDFDWAAKQAERHGMERDDAFLIYQNQGRPLNLHQITQALAWGATYNPGQGDDPDPWMQAVLLGAVRPEYYEMQHTLKYTLPSAFYFRALQEQGVLKEADAATWYRRLGWPPELVDLVAKAYAQPAAAAADPHVAKAATQLWTTTHRSYIGQMATAADVRQRFDLLEIPAAAQTTILELWASERALIRAQLTPKEVKKAVDEKVINPATGAAWTHDEAIAELVERGYSLADAETFLAE